MIVNPQKFVSMEFVELPIIQNHNQLYLKIVKVLGDHGANVPHHAEVVHKHNILLYLNKLLAQENLAHPVKNKLELKHVIQILVPRTVKLDHGVNGQFVVKIADKVHKHANVQ